MEPAGERIRGAFNHTPSDPSEVLAQVPKTSSEPSDGQAARDTPNSGGNRRERGAQARAERRPGETVPHVSVGFPCASDRTFSCAGCG